MKLDVLLGQVRAEVAHRLGAGLVLEARLTRPDRPYPVPFVLGYTPAPDGDLTLAHAYAGASAVTVLDDGYLFLSDTKARTGRSLRRHRPETKAELVLSPGRDVVSYAAASSVVIAAAWVPADQADPHRTAAMVDSDLWPHSSYQSAGEVLGLLRTSLDPGPPEPLEVALAPNERLTGLLAVTPDGARCAAGVVRFLRGGHRRHGLLLIPVTDPAAAQAVWLDDDLRDAVPSPDGSWFACTAERVATPELGPRQEVVLVASDGSRILRPAAQHPHWLQPKAWSGRTLLCAGEADGRRRLYRVTSEGDPPEPVELAGSVQSVTATSAEVLVVQSRVDLPPEVVVVDLDDPPARTLLAPAADATPAGRMERLSHRAEDGTVWYSWLCLPADERDEPLPVLVWCHGGPLLSWTDWSWRWNPWPFVAEGYAVLMPDPPLSMGYGQEAVERGWGRWSSEVASVAAEQVRAALRRPDLDPRRVAAMGGSFGGYLALALATRLPEIRLVASHAGWADFAAVARACDLHWHWLREYGPVEESEAYRRESLAMESIDPGVTVLLSHGCADSHVPVGETRAMYRSLDTRKADVRLMLLPDEGHSIERPANVTAWYDWVRAACAEVLTP
ncbi:S9 family peptidase [Streptomyces sp. H27-D2]|uniref:S9 family peptidase n=1 Tax=Streptomyces sp. H27-D2 TaxID=3046304 RepID=UPI002DB8D6C3|nr:prolyl oligopeptidase family serine peptidase [Streptomyces sp. H27-D2]MEC4019765.1 prolyl oligopeptidase family serine peptidase [Streptomyces sp. H27-D2]